MNIFVGNLSFKTKETEIRELFEQYGEVISVKLINNRETGKPRGFGFVEMNDSDAEAAINSLNGKEFAGRNLQVNEARQREDAPQGNRRFSRR